MATPATPSYSEMGYDAFAPPRHAEHYLTYYGIDGATKAIQVRRFTRGEFWALGCRAAALLQEAGLTRGDAATHYFTDNRLEDLAFRLGAVLLGTVPVTINWQADTPERVVHKVRATKSKAMVVDADVPAEQIEACREAMGGALAIVVAADRLAATSPLPAAGFASGLRKVDPRIVIFTSGTTGQPKGVSLSYGAYDTNRATFEDFLQVPAEGVPGTFELVATNPMHHTNSTAVTDWTLRRPADRGYADLHGVASADLNWKQLNLSFGYELPLYASVLGPSLGSIGCTEEGFAEARRLLDMLAPFTPLPPNMVPPHSPTRAFLGGAWL